jgi:hypothetical protein
MAMGWTGQESVTGRVPAATPRLWGIGSKYKGVRSGAQKDTGAGTGLRRRRSRSVAGGRRARRGNPEPERRIGGQVGRVAPDVRLGGSMPNERVGPASAWRSGRCGLPLLVAVLAAGCAETTGPDPARPASGSGASLEGRIPFPADNPWNTEISGDAVDPNSAAYIAACGLRNLHPDFGTVWNGAPNGIPYVVVSGRQTRVPVSFEYADESDPGRTRSRRTRRSRAARARAATVTCW